MYCERPFEELTKLMRHISKVHEGKQYQKKIFNSENPPEIKENPSKIKMEKVESKTNAFESIPNLIGHNVDETEGYDQSYDQDCSWQQPPFKQNSVKIEDNSEFARSETPPLVDMNANFEAAPMGPLIVNPKTILELKVLCNIILFSRNSG